MIYSILQRLIKYGDAYIDIYIYIDSMSYPHHPYRAPQEKADRPQLSLGLLESALQNAVPAGETPGDVAISGETSGGANGMDAPAATHGDFTRKTWNK